MITYVGRVQCAQQKRAAAIVIPERGADGAALRNEIQDAIRNAQLVGWDLSEVPDLDQSVLEFINHIAQIEETLVVIVNAQPPLAQRIERGLTNLVLGTTSDN